MVLCIFVLITIPFKIFPRIETALVNGHFLSTYLDSIASLGVLKPNPIFLKYLTPEDDFLAISFLLLRKTVSCFWKARSCYVLNLYVLGCQPSIYHHLLNFNNLIFLIISIIHNIFI